MRLCYFGNWVICFGWVEFIVSDVVCEMRWEMGKMIRGGSFIDNSVKDNMKKFVHWMNIPIETGDQRKK